MNKLIIYKLFNASLTISLSLLILILSSYFFIFDKQFYTTEFRKLGVNDKFENANEFNSDMLEYLYGKRDELPAQIELNEREISHMKDVKNVFSFFSTLNIILLLLIISLGVVLFYLKQLRIYEILKWTGVFSLIISVLLILFFYFGFNASFCAFHKLFFQHDTWLFKAEDNIINVYPADLFFDISIRIFSLYLGVAAFLIIAYLIFRKSKLV